MADITLVSYDLNGKKLSFADWISNLSPDETPFVSMTGKESVIQTLFQWQTDTLEAASDTNAVVEGSVAEAPIRKTTTTLNNVTQILRKVVKVSDTSQTLANYGRGNELKYQMEKAGKEIKRDLEVILLSDQERVDGDATTIARKTSGFQKLVAEFEVADPDTGAVVHKAMAGETPTEAEIFDMTYNLYLSGSKSNIIMFHPKFASFFSSLMEVSEGSSRVKLFEGEDKRYSKYVTEIVDPLGCTYKLVPNRWMPETAIYFLSASDWTQMVLRAPERTKLAKDGSYEKWMLEMEVGLRHRHPYASGVLLVKSVAPAPSVESVTLNNTNYYGGFASNARVLQIGAAATAEGVTATVTTATVTIAPVDASQAFTAVSSDPTVATVAIQGNQVKITALKEGTTTLTVASVDDPTKTDTATVTIYDRSVSTDSISDMYPTQTSTLGKSIDTATPAPTWTYATLDAGVATVSTAGVITAVAGGFTRIRAIAAINGIRFYDQSGVDVEAVVTTATAGNGTVATGATLATAPFFNSTPASAHAQGYTYAIVPANVAVATIVPATGVVTGVSAGTVNVVATSKADVTKSATKVVDVT